MKRVNSKGVASYAPTVTATLALAITFTFNSCSTDGGGGGSVGYCVIDNTKTCVTGLNGKQCKDEHDGYIGACPSGYDGGSQTGNPSSSSNRTPSISSSSNIGTKPSSSSNGSGGYTGSYGSLTYQGKTYKTVVIGTQTWMAENLNYNASGSKCYDNLESNCNIYGRLYDWATAMGIDKKYNGQEWNSSDAKHRGICPSGWHLPSNADWDKLMRYVDGSTGTSSPYDSPTAGRYLKATSGWNSGGNGSDTYGFSALPGGLGDYDGSFYDHGGFWRSASEYSSGSAYFRRMYNNGENVHYDYHDKILLQSVRCLQD